MSQRLSREQLKDLAVVTQAPVRAGCDRSFGPRTGIHAATVALYPGFVGTTMPDNDTAPLAWGQFAGRGIDTLGGRSTTSEAAIQVLTLPVLILGWGLAVAIIVAFT